MEASAVVPLLGNTEGHLDSASFRLLDLPTEIRLMIYGYLIPDSISLRPDIYDGVIYIEAEGQWIPSLNRESDDNRDDDSQNGERFSNYGGCYYLGTHTLRVLPLVCKKIGVEVNDYVAQKVAVETKHRFDHDDWEARCTLRTPDWLPKLPASIVSGLSLDHIAFFESDAWGNFDATVKYLAESLKSLPKLQFLIIKVGQSAWNPTGCRSCGFGASDDEIWDLKYWLLALTTLVSLKRITMAGLRLVRVKIDDTKYDASCLFSFTSLVAVELKDTEQDSDNVSTVELDVDEELQKALKDPEKRRRFVMMMQSSTEPWMEEMVDAYPEYYYERDPLRGGLDPELLFFTDMDI